MNKYTGNSVLTESKFMQQKLTEVEGEIEQSMVIVENFNTLFSVCGTQV
jgi:hypothetical protein